MCKFALMVNLIKNVEKGLVIQIDMLLITEGKYHIAYIPSLNITAHAKNEEEAEIRVKKAVNMFFETWAKKGSLDEKLIKLGWKKSKSHFIPTDNFNVNVPYSYLKNKPSIHKVPITYPKPAYIISPSK